MLGSTCTHVMRSTEKYKNVYKLYKPYTNHPTNRSENLYKLYKLFVSRKELIIS